MKNDTFGVGLVVGFCLALIFVSVFTVPVVRHHSRDAMKWRAQWELTRGEWLQERQEWRDGVPFQLHYGPHGERW